MRIKQIEIKNFRGLRHWKWKLQAPDDCLVLFGPNGCGKTTVLDAVLMALGRNNLVGRAWPEGQDWKIELEIEGENGLRYKICKAPDAKESKCVNPHTPFTGCETTRFSYFEHVLYVPSWRHPNFSGSIGINSGDDSSDSPAGSDDAKPMDIESYFFDYIPYKDLAQVKQQLVNLKSASAFDASAKIHADEIFAQLNDIWNLFYPSAGLSFEAMMAPNRPSNNPLFDVYMTHENGNARIPVDGLSSGEIDIFTLMANIFLEEPQYELIVFDEPELHLHQQWRKAILPALRKAAPDAQIIAASHSAEIWNSVYDSQKCLMPAKGED